MGSLVDVIVQLWRVIERDERVVARTWGIGTDLARISGGSVAEGDWLGKTVWTDEVAIRGGWQVSGLCRVRRQRSSGSSGDRRQY